MLKRVVAYGYRYGEVNLPPVGEVKDGTKIKIRTMPPDFRRPPVAASLGCHAVDAALPHVDPTDVPTAVAGVQKRFATKPPAPDPELRAHFRTFVRSWVRSHFDPLSPDVDTSPEAWLESCNYTQARKKELLDKYYRMLNIHDRRMKYFHCKSFIKDEVYQALKHARCINSRSDEFKVTVGPIFRLIEKVVFQYEAFIKKIPVADRPKYIRDLLYVEGADYFAADYTAFESLFTADLMEDCEMQLYEWMVRDLPGGSDWLKIIREALLGENVCDFKDFSVKVPATRMSGEMNTSLGNGFTNLMVLLFLAEYKGCTNIKVVVEGDDSAARMTGPRPTKEDFAKLGLNCKVEFHTKIEHMSFCGLVFDVDDLINVTNPMEVLATTGWTNQAYVKSRKSKLDKLLRCKALSLAHQYPGCPIISGFAQYLLRSTRRISNKSLKDYLEKSTIFSLWEKDQLIEAVRDERKIKVLTPPKNTRLLVNDLYGITLEQQYQAEKYFEGLGDLQPFKLTALFCNVPDEWQDYSVKYTRYVNVRSAMCLEPAGLSARLAEYMINVNDVPERIALKQSQTRF